MSLHHDADAPQNPPFPIGSLFDSSAFDSSAFESSAFEDSALEATFDDAYPAGTISEDDLIPATFEVDTTTMLQLFRLLKRETERQGSTASARGATRGRASWNEQGQDGSDF